MATHADFRRELEALERKYRENNPADVLQFCFNFFNQRLVDERIKLLSSTTSPQAKLTQPPSSDAYPEKKFKNMTSGFTASFGSNTNSPFGFNSNPFAGGGRTVTRSISPGAITQVTEEDETMDSVNTFSTHSFLTNDPANTVPPPAASSQMLRIPPNGTENFNNSQFSIGRRTSVSAESLKPESSENWSPPVHPKTPRQLERLKLAISDNFLFSHLDEEQSALILSALVEKPIPAKGIKVISQGDVGDYFYIVEKGTFDFYVNPAGSLQPGPDGMGNHVGSVSEGGSFGELALMYNAPRAATVVSTEAGCNLWALDRITFRRILMESTFARRRMYENFLEEVPLLQSLTKYERSKIADALEIRKFDADATIIQEGDVGQEFYLLVSGEAMAYKRGVANPVKQYKKGDFFGELALLNDKPRAATIVAKTEVKVASLEKKAFARLLGPVESIMRRTEYVGVKTGVEDMDPLDMRTASISSTA